MKAAVVQGPGKTPAYLDFPEPAPAPGDVRIRVVAAALSPLVRGRASGAHYSATSAFPFVAGIDGVGRLDDGARVYFGFPKSPNGAMAETTATASAFCVPLPDALDDLTAAAIANPGMSSWAALTERAKLRPGETVLINGATGTAGRLAVQIARHLGAGRVIATGRNTETLSTLGADATIPLVEDGAALEKTFGQVFGEGVDVVIDYLWGKSAESLLRAAARAGKPATPLRFVQVGSASGGEIALPSAVLRASDIQLTGSGLGSVPFDRLIQSIGALLQAAVPAGFTVAYKAVPLSDVERAWGEDDAPQRTVVTME